MKIKMLLPVVLLISACASNSETETDPDQEERTSGFQVSASAGGDTVMCPNRQSSCYYNVVRACGELGVVEVGMDRGHVSTAGGRGSTDDPFARMDAARSPSAKPVTLKCGDP